MRRQNPGSGNESGAYPDVDREGEIAGGCDGIFELVDGTTLRLDVVRARASGGGTDPRITESRWVLSRGSVTLNQGRLIDIIPAQVPDGDPEIRCGCYGIFGYGDGTVLRIDVAGAKSFGSGTDPTITDSRWLLSRGSVTLSEGRLVEIMRAQARGHEQPRN